MELKKKPSYTIGLISADITWKGINKVSDSDSEVLDPYPATGAISDQVSRLCGI
jgi:hypothetical protein